MAKEYEQHSVDQARSQASKIDDHPTHTPASLESMGDKEYFRSAYPEGYGLEDKVTKEHRIQAADANLNLFRHRKATFFQVIPEQVKESGLNDSSKEFLIKRAHSAWELRAVTDEDSGETRNYFYVRDDIDLNRSAEENKAHHEVEAC